MSNAQLLLLGFIRVWLLLLMLLLTNNNNNKNLKYNYYTVYFKIITAASTIIIYFFFFFVFSCPSSFFFLFLSWACYMLFYWSCLVYSRPSHNHLRLLGAWLCACTLLFGAAVTLSTVGLGLLEHARGAIQQRRKSSWVYSHATWNWRDAGCKVLGKIKHSRLGNGEHTNQASE